MTVTERPAVLGRLIQKECGAARNALPCDTQFEGELFDALLATPDAMAAYGAPPVTSTTDVVRPEPVPFDREAFRREAALRMLETEKGRYGAAEDAARSVILADALIAALEGPPRGT